MYVNLSLQGKNYRSASSYQESLVGGIWDYMFTKKTTTWRLAVEMKDSSKDIYSKKLKTKRKKENWSKKIDKFHRRVIKSLINKAVDFIKSLKRESIC